MCCDPVLRAQPPFEPSPDAVGKHVDLEPVPASVAVARSFVRDAIEDMQEAGQDVALLLTSELVTNAILHARTPVQVGVFVDHARTLVCVSDRMPDSQALTPGAHSPDRPGGRGLALVDDLALSWGTTTCTEGKTVWFLLPTGPDPSLRTG